MSHYITYSGCNITGNGSCAETNENLTACKAEGLLLPILNESGWPTPFRAGMYMAGLIYCFLGISIVADVFMCSIEKITSRTRKIKIPNPEAEGGYEKIEVGLRHRIWCGYVLTIYFISSCTSRLLMFNYWDKSLMQRRCVGFFIVKIRVFPLKMMDLLWTTRFYD